MFLDTVFRWEFFSHPRAGLRPRLRVALNQVRAWHETYRPVSYTHLDVYKRQVPAPSGSATVGISALVMA